jgi:hypothetical protein
MGYTVKYSDGNKTPITVATATVDTTTNIGLVGKGYIDFGEVVAEDLLHMLENFANFSAPSKPVEGQLWYDSAANSLKYFDETIADSGNWKPVASMSYQSIAPTTVGEKDGHFWLDSDTGLLYIYYNGAWVVIADTSGDTRVIARTRYDTNDATHRTLEFVVAGKIVSITSSDTTDWTPQNSGINTEYLEDGVTFLNTEFTTITQGINLNEGDAYFFSGTATSALYADLAERYESDAVYSYGHVVKIGGEKEITETNTADCTDVFGIISDSPAFAMNSGAGNAKTHPYVALSGRVPVKVIGRVNKGERLVASATAGHAQAASLDADWRSIIGRALENKIDDGYGHIEVVVGTK